MTVAFVSLVAAGGRAQCDGDFDLDGSVEIHELIRAVGNALSGCTPVPPTATSTPPPSPTLTLTATATVTPTLTLTATATPTASSSATASATATATALPRCGDGLADPEEECDGVDLNGRTCADLGAGDFGLLACSDGCAFDSSGCAAARLIDNGDGTITDHGTGLVWEKKCAVCGGLHDVDNRYPWEGSCAVAASACRTDADCPGGETCAADDDQGTGLTAFEWVAALNAEAFAGADDWRLPSVDELTSLRDLTTFDPAVPPPFQRNACPTLTDPLCSRTFPSNYWSATTLAMDAGSAWDVNFDDGSVDSSGKSGTSYVRAVRDRD